MQVREIIIAMNSASSDAGAWIQMLKHIQLDVTSHRGYVDSACGFIADLPVSAVFAQQSDEVYWAIGAAVDAAPFLYGRSYAMSRIAPEAWNALEQAVDMLEGARVTLRQPIATLGAVGPALDNANRLLCATDARIDARVAELLRML